MSIGGIGTLRGFDYKSIQGDQSFVANGEYYVLVRKNIYAFGFLDFGDSWYGRDNVPRIHPALDGGLGLRLGQGPIAITAARSLQSADAPILIGVRLGGSF
jgi:hemolysin activation/secretion protein